MKASALYAKLLEDIRSSDTPREKTSNKDETMWLPTVGEDGNGSAVIRFLPPKEGESIAWAHYWSHSFKDPGTGNWYIENSRTSLGKEVKDPVGVLNAQLWKMGDEGQAQARRQKRTENYVSNILVVKDPGNRENEGKVFKYRYGKKIFEKIKGAMMPDEELGVEGMNPFDLESGANFILKIKNVKSGENTFRNYDDSTFSTQSKVVVDMDSVYSLEALVSPDNFKSYEELEKRLNKVLGLDSGEDNSSRAPAQEEAPKKETAKETPKQAPKVESKASSVDDIDMSEIDAMFKDLEG